MSDFVLLVSKRLAGFIGAGDDQTGIQSMQFFNVKIRNAHTRRAYALGVNEFLDWCESAAVESAAS